MPSPPPFAASDEPWETQNKRKNTIRTQNRFKEARAGVSSGQGGEMENEDRGRSAPVVKQLTKKEKASESGRFQADIAVGKKTILL